MHSSGALARYTLPQDVPVEELAHYVGPCLEDVDVTAPGDPVAAEREVWLTDDLGCLPVQQGAEGGRWLGVIVFTPHFRPIRAAVRCLHHHGLQHVLDVIQEQAPGGGIRNGQICVPVRPQPFPGFGTFLRFPAIVRHHPKGRIAATVIDLRRLGGHMFACLLPQRMPVDELFDFVTRMVAYSEEPFVLVVGCQDRPHDPQFPLHLQDGDLLAFDRGQRPPRNTSSIHHLFADDAYWGDAANVPSITPSVGVLLQHQGDEVTFEGHAILTFFAEEEAPPVEAQSLFINLSDAEDDDLEHDMEEAFLAIQETRDPISARLFPWLILIDPQPAQGYGILLALPGWAAQDTVICLDSSGIDGRLFVAGAPVAADRGILLDLAGLSPHDIFDVYVGASPVAMREDAVADLHSGLCIFYTHRHALPGPFFQLRDTLLTSDVWEDDPAIPRGPDEEHLCVVWDMGHRRIRLGETRFQADPEAAAQLAGLAASAVVSRLAAPAVTDASVAGMVFADIGKWPNLSK
ncbi:unnamed protein product [Symbiodinium sp. KB8]|nr:unnamed protein product [Symbiodinium sp. KB8]